MKKKLMTQVTNSIFEVLETMFFLTVEQTPIAGGSPAPGQGDVRACSITFSGHFSGRIFLQIPLELLYTMTENFLGQDRDTLTDEHVDGTLKEALNMIAGDALTRIDQDSYMGLGIPEIESLPFSESMDETAAFMTENGMVTVSAKLD